MSLQHALDEFRKQLIHRLYPNLEPSKRRKVIRLCAAKGINIVDMALVEPVLDSVVCSVIRHTVTDYDNMLCHVERSKARGIIQPIIAKQLSAAKGGVKVEYRPVSEPVQVLDPSTPTFESKPKTKKLTALQLNNPVFENLSGRRHGRFTVIGMSSERKGRWVVQCDCFTYEMFTAKALREGTAPIQCRHCINNG